MAEGQSLGLLGADAGSAALMQLNVLASQPAGIDIPRTGDSENCRTGFSGKVRIAGTVHTQGEFPHYQPAGIQVSRSVDGKVQFRNPDVL